MGATSIIVTLLGLAALGGTVWVFLRTRAAPSAGLPLVVRIPVILAPLSAGVLLFTVLSLICASPLFDWNGAKLAPTYGMLKGYPLYPDRDTGVMTAWIYGPVPALLMMPVAAVARTPTVAIVLACVLNMLLVLAPAVWLHLRASSSPSSRRSVWVTLLAFATFLWLFVSNESMLRATFLLGPDGAALGLLSCSIALLIRRRPDSRLAMLWLALSALCAVLACWCKQTVVPALVVAPLYLLLVDGWLDAVSYAVALLILGVVVSMIFLLSFGAGNVWFHMVTLSANHGWRGDAVASRWALFGSACLSLLNELTPTIAFFGAALLVERFLMPQPAAVRDRFIKRAARWCRANPWIMLPALAVVLLPSALLGYLKVGGYVNNFALTHFFVIVGATVYLIGLHARASQSSARVVIVALLALFLLWAWPQEFLKRHKIEEMFRGIANVRNNQQETAFAFARKEPGKGYFPWQVFSSLLAEGKYYHFEWGIVDRIEAGLPPSRAQSTAHLPGKMQFVGYGPRGQSDYAMALFDPPQGRFSHSDLAGFVVYPETLANVKAKPDLGQASQRFQR